MVLIAFTLLNNTNSLGTINQIFLKFLLHLITHKNFYLGVISRLLACLLPFSVIDNPAKKLPLKSRYFFSKVSKKRKFNILVQNPDGQIINIC